MCPAGLKLKCLYAQLSLQVWFQWSHPLPSRRTTRAVSEILEQISCPQLANMKSRQACSFSCSPRSEGSQRLGYGEIETDADEKQSLQGLTLIFFLPLWNTLLVVWRKVSSHADLATMWDFFQSCLCESLAPASSAGTCEAGEFLSLGSFPFLGKLEKCRCSLIYS